MKFIFIVALVSFWVTTFSQITLEQSFPNQRIDIVHLRTSGPKYLQYNFSTYSATLLNLDFTVFKSISFPHVSNNYNVGFYSEDLFDTDSSTIEYVMTYSDSANSGFRIYSIDSTLIFQLDSGAIIYANEYGAFKDLPYAPIFNTDSGTKMIVAFANPTLHPYETRIYRLPGKQAEICCLSTLTNGIVHLINKQERINNYPNPFKSSETIEYSLPAGCTKSVLIISDSFGKAIKEYSLSAFENKIETIETSLSAGNYLFTIQCDGNIIATKKVVKVN